MLANLRLPCLTRPKAAEGKPVGQGALMTGRLGPGQQKPSMAPTLLAGQLQRPKVSLEKVKNLSSNAVTTAARYHHRNLAEDYNVLSNKVLGEGCSGKVVVAEHRVSGRKCALKRIKKSKVAPRVLQQLIAEVEICLTLDHPHVIHLQDVYDTDHEIALLTEVLEGGELYGRLAAAKVFPEVLAAETTRQMLRAVGYLHSHNVVHRDLKLENVLFESKAVDSPLQVIDFGFAKVWDSSRLMQASCGSVAYVSPDVLRGDGYTSQCDLWGLGVIVFMLLAGYPPFHGSDDDMRTSIIKADVDWKHPRRWAKVSHDAIDFVAALLRPSPGERLDAQAALNHRWLTATVASNRPTLSAAAIRSINSYADAPLLRRAVLQLVARELAPEEVADLRCSFLEIAGDEEGTVRLSELKAAIRGDAPVDCTGPEPKTPARRTRRASTDKLTELFQAMDVNGDQQIYYSDFLAATMSEEHKVREEHLRAAFRRLDADNSGAISAADIVSTIGETFEGVETHCLMRDAGLSPSGMSPSARGEISFDMFVNVLNDESGIATPTDDSSGTFTAEI